MELTSGKSVVKSGFTDTVTVGTLNLDGVTSYTYTSSIPAQKLGTSFYVLLKVVDSRSTTDQSTLFYSSVIPKSGKFDLTDEPTNVNDLMRLVYLVLDFPGVEMRLIDFLGLDLDNSGAFGGGDLDMILDIWRSQ
jgi:hypothetical protein